MSKKSRLISQPAGRPPWLGLATGGAVLLILAGLLIWVWPGSAPAGDGSPQLEVDKTSVDEGYVQFDVPVRSSFNLSNAGSEPLRILGEPQVELVEGC